MPKNGATPALHTRCDTYGYLPPTSTISTHTSNKIKKRGHSRACHLIRKRKGTLHRSQVKQKDRNDQAHAKRLNTAFSSPTIGPTAPPHRQIKSRDVVLEQLEQLCTHFRLRHAMMSARCLAHPLPRVERTGGRRWGCFAGHRATSPSKNITMSPSCSCLLQCYVLSYSWVLL